MADAFVGLKSRGKEPLLKQNKEISTAIQKKNFQAGPGHSTFDVLGSKIMKGNGAHDKNKENKDNEICIDEDSCEEEESEAQE